MRLRKIRKMLLIAVFIIMPAVAFFWSQGGVPSWSCLWANVRIAFASPDLNCTTTCTNWSAYNCSGYSSCYNKQIWCINGKDRNGKNCQGCCFACEVKCDNPDPNTAPIFTLENLSCTQDGANGWCIGTQTLDLTATESKGRNILISGDVDGNPFACTEQASPASCSIPLPEGSGGINYTALSSIGLSSSGSTSWKRDATSPTINGQVDQPQNANNWFSANINVTASASDATPGSGLLSFKTSLDDATWTTYAGSLAFGEGTRTLYLRATDNAGNVEKINIPLNVDLTNPAPSRVIGGLSGSNGWYSSAITVTASATDNLSGVDFLETTTDGSNWTTYGAPLTLTDGAYTFQVRATDLAGNQASTASETLRVDATAPSTSISLSGTPGSANWYTSAVSANISSTDATSGVASKSYNLNGAGWAAYSIPLTLNDGVHTLQARATDYAGHQGLSTLETIYVDTTAPTLELFLDGGTSFMGWHPAEVEISASASDAGSGLSSFELSVNGGAWQSYAAPFTLSDGTHSVEARATDVAGNLVTLSKTVNVDTTSPGISLMLNGTAGNGDWFVSSVEASAIASAPGSGIASFEYALAGGNWQSYTAPLSFEDGVHILYLRAENNAGKTQELTQIIKVDTTAPAIALPDAWGSGEYVYYETEDSLSGLDSLRLVIEDENERYQKAVIKKSLSGNNYDAAFLWDEKWGDGTYAIPGTYYLCVKVSDVAGNQGIQCGAITVSEEEAEDEAPVVVVPTEPPVEAATVVEDAPQPAAPETSDILPTESKATGFSFGSSPKEPAATTSASLPLAATAAAALGASLAITRKKKEKKAGSRIPILGKAKQAPVPASAQGSATITSAQPASPNVLWGSAASSVIGAFTAKVEEQKRKIEEERRRKAEEEARRAQKIAEAAEERRKAWVEKPKSDYMLRREAEKNGTLAAFLAERRKNRPKTWIEKPKSRYMLRRQAEKAAQEELRLAKQELIAHKEALNERSLSFKEKLLGLKDLPKRRRLIDRERNTVGPINPPADPPPPVKPFIVGAPDNSGAHPSDVDQGVQARDCFVISSLAAIASRNPSLLEKNLVPNPDGTYSVTLYTQPGFLKPSTSFIVNVSNNDYPSDPKKYASTGDQKNSQEEIWVQVYETAYMKSVGGYDRLYTRFSETVLPQRKLEFWHPCYSSQKEPKS